VKEKIIELMNDWQEIEVYRKLAGVPFDFGTGLITDDSTQSEDVYWKMEQENIKNQIWDLFNQKNRKTKYKYKNKYIRKQIGKNKLKRLSKVSWWFAYYDKDKGRHIRCYESGRKKYAKWCSDRAVRNRNDFPLKGGGYRKVYDYWWVVF
jgi:hypothetical protein